MSSNKSESKKLLFMFSKEITDELDRIRSKEIPSEILYGVMELKDNGWNVEISNDRHQGVFGSFNSRIKSLGFNLIDFSTIKKIAASDVVVVKGEFSLMTTVVCRLLGKKIIYKDAMFKFPKWFWRKWSAYINLRLSSAIIAYSKHQARLWETYFGLQQGAIDTIDYSIDTAFYPELEYAHKPDSYVLSVGRDMGRDYGTLSRALITINRKGELVTLPYLLSEDIKSNANINIQQRIPYDQLFDLYQNCICSVVPLRKNLSYPSGIRGILESLALGIPTIATRTPVLTEYFTDGEDLIFVDPNDHVALANAITELSNNSELAMRISVNGKNTVRTRYNMCVYTRNFENILNRLAV